jgi:predicted RNA-binding Zn-ribbon protein involved in translation (DUF1610 family)
MDAASRIADDAAKRCPACDGEVLLELLDPAGDAPCPHCGALLWFLRTCRRQAVVFTFLQVALGSFG